METSTPDRHIEPVRYGVVGLGRAGWINHIGQLRDRLDARVVAVADPQAERREEAKQALGCRAYTGIDQMLSDDQVEVVLIATPSIHHARDSIMALQAGKHVIVEKPMAMNVQEVDDMVAASRQAGRHLFAHHQHRFRAPFVLMKQVIDSGRLGAIYHIRNYISRFQRRYDWQTLASMGGGELKNTCPHFLDQMLQLLGAPVNHVMADLQRIVWVGDAEDHVKVLMRTGRGVTGDMEITNGQALPHPLPLWIVCGTHGTLTLDVGVATVRWFDPTQVPKIAPIPGPAVGREYASGELPWQEQVIELDTVKTQSFYDNVYDVLRHGKPMRVTPESARELIRVMDLITASANKDEASVAPAPRVGVAG